MNDVKENIDEAVRNHLRRPAPTGGASAVAARLLAPARPKRTYRALVVGACTGALGIGGALFFLAPARADASADYDRLVRRVSERPNVYKRVFQRGPNGWVVRLEVWVEGEKETTAWGDVIGGGCIALDGRLQSVANPKTNELTVKRSSGGNGVRDAWPNDIRREMVRAGMRTVNVRRDVMHGGRVCDVYRLNYRQEPNDSLYYVDVDSNLPFRFEVVNPRGEVLDYAEFEFPNDIPDVVFTPASIAKRLRFPFTMVVEGPDRGVESRVRVASPPELTKAVRNVLGEAPAP